MNGRRIHGLFVGLSTLDVIQVVDRIPRADEKIAARAVSVAAGGPATNAAVVFAALGGRATLLTRISDDPIGALVSADLGDQRVRVVNVGATSPTIVASILVTAATGERAVVSAIDQSRSPEDSEYNDAGSLDAGLIDEVAPSVMLMDSHLTDLSLPLAAEATAREIPVVLDCGHRKPCTERQLRHTTAAVVSDSYLTGNSAEIAEAVRESDVPYGAVTAGAGPLTYWTPEGIEAQTMRVPQVTAVDTLGAGDFLHGALAFAIARDGLTAFPSALAFAAEVAARSVQEFGSRSWLEQLRQDRVRSTAAGSARGRRRTAWHGDRRR